MTVGKVYERLRGCPINLLGLLCAMNVSPPYSYKEGTLFVAKMWPILGPLHDLTCYYLPLVVASNEGCGS